MKNIFQPYWNEKYNEDLRRFYKQNSSSDELMGQKRRKLSPFSEMEIQKPKNIDYSKHNNQFEVSPTRQILQMRRNKNGNKLNPQIQRTMEQLRDSSLAKIFMKKYTSLWMLVCHSDHKAQDPFEQLFPDQKANQPNYRIDNLITIKQILRIKHFTNQGLDINVMMDLDTYQKCYKNKRQQLQKNDRILSVCIESTERVKSSQKIKVTQDLIKFIQEKVKPQIQKSRRDKPYFNFVHFESSAQFFNRRSIIQGCLYSKTEQQILERHQNLYKILIQYTKDLETNKISGIEEETNDEVLRSRLIKKQNKQTRKKIKIHEQFYTQFKKYISEYHPLEQQQDKIKEQVYNWVIIKYSQQCNIYPILNNTIRYAFNQAKIQPVSGLVQYIYKAVRHYFTSGFRSIKYRKVYRGGIASIIEQKYFQEGRYLWNLGFMSTSLNPRIAQNFEKQRTQDLTLRFIINIPESSFKVNNIQQQQGFWAIHLVPQIAQKIISQQEVLFNPLNIFRIKKFDKQKRLLQLDYSPHLEIIERQKNNQPLLEQQKNLLLSINKLKMKDYDKGMKYYQQGDPIETIKYYQASKIQGKVLSIIQKNVYLESLQDIGDLKKIDQLLCQQIQLQSQQTQQLNTIQKIANSIASFQYYQQSTQFEKMNKKAENIVEAIPRTQILPEYNNVFLQIRGYLQLANVKYQLNQTLSAVKSCLKCFLLLDQLAIINLVSILFNLLLSIKQLKYVNFAVYKNLTSLLFDNKQMIDQFNQQKQKQKVIVKINAIHKQKWIQLFKFGSKFFEDGLEIKEYNSLAEKLLKNYLPLRQKQREQKNSFYKLEQMIIQTYWELQSINILSKNNQRAQIQLSKLIQQKQMLKNIKLQLSQAKIEFNKVYLEQSKVYELLYKILYRTSLDVSPCLSAHRKFYIRYEHFMRIQCQSRSSSQLSKVLRRHGQVLLEYGSIIQAELNTNDRQSQAIKSGADKLKQANKILENLNKRNPRKKIFTKQKLDILNARAEYLNNKLNQSENAKKSTMSGKIKIIRKQSEVKKAEVFQELTNIIQKIERQYIGDSNLNPVMFKLDLTTKKIKLFNQSSAVNSTTESYQNRLSKCSAYFSQVIQTIKKYQYEELMDRNLKMCHIYYLMAQNKYKLGLINKAIKYLVKAESGLKILLKIDEQNSGINKKKLVYGNKTMIGILKLKASIVVLGKNANNTTAFLDQLIPIKIFIEKNMHEPLFEADICQSISILSSHLVQAHKQQSFNIFKNSIEKAIKIRSAIFGKNNKKNACSYSTLMNIDYIYNNYQYTEQTEQYYQNGIQIYNNIDYASDPTLMFYHTYHLYGKLLYHDKYQGAAKQIISGFQLFIQHPNQIVSMQTIQYLYNGASILMGISKYQKQGIREMKICLKRLEQLNKYIKEQQNEEDSGNFDNILQLLQGYKQIKTQNKIAQLKQVVLEELLIVEGENIKLKSKNIAAVTIQKQS